MRAPLIALSPIGDLPAPSACKRRASVTPRTEEQSAEARAWSIAVSPASNIVMIFVMFWFAGSSASIYTVAMVCQTVKTQFGVFLAVDDKFKSIEGRLPTLRLYKFVYRALSIAVMLFVAYRVYGIGLLPFFPSDYVGSLSKAVSERQIPIISIE